jgi:hypothetical protein
LKHSDPTVSCPEIPNRFFAVCGKFGKSGFGKRNFGKKIDTLEEMENRSGRIGKDPRNNGTRIGIFGKSGFGIFQCINKIQKIELILWIVLISRLITIFWNFSYFSYLNVVYRKRLMLN